MQSTLYDEIISVKTDIDNIKKAHGKNKIFMWFINKYAKFVYRRIIRSLVKRQYLSSPISCTELKDICIFIYKIDLDIPNKINDKTGYNIIYNNGKFTFSIYNNNSKIMVLEFDISTTIITIEYNDARIHYVYCIQGKKCIEIIKRTVLDILEYYLYNLNNETK